MSSIGRVFRVTTFGESHGSGVGCVIEGVPPGIKLVAADHIQPQLDRRRPGQSILTTARAEMDTVQIMSGHEHGRTLGSPLTLIIYNKDQRKFDYADTSQVPRPGHADLTYRIKYGIQASSGGGRASARETAARVAAGAVAERWMEQLYGTTVASWVSSVHDIDLPKDVAAELEANPPSRADIDRIGTVEGLSDGNFVDCDGLVYGGREGNCLGPAKQVYPQGRPEAELTNVATRCPHAATAVRIAIRIKEMRAAGDSVGGVLTTVATKVPAGLGEPVFDKVEAELASAMMSLPATKGFEMGSGFGCSRMTGSEHNDRFGAKEDDSDLLRPITNHAGGALGGITTGAHIVFRVALKPVSSIGMEQETADYNGKTTRLGVKGRHDPCVLPRAPPVTEAMTALVLADLAMLQRARRPLAPMQTLGDKDE